MRIDADISIHIHHYGTSQESLEILRRIDQRTLQLMTDLTRLTSEVTEIGTTVDSAVALLGQLAQLIRDNATDPAALNSLADSLDSKGNELAAAVVANTPEAPPTP